MFFLGGGEGKAVLPCAYCDMLMYAAYCYFLSICFFNGSGVQSKFFAILSFARMAKNCFAPHDSVAPLFPIFKRQTKQEFLHLYICSSVNFPQEEW